MGNRDVGGVQISLPNVPPFHKKKKKWRTRMRMLSLGALMVDV